MLPRRCTLALFVWKVERLKDPAWSKLRVSGHMRIMFPSARVSARAILMHLPMPRVRRLPNSYVVLPASVSRSAYCE